MNRILWNERPPDGLGGGDIDEIVLHDAILHIEQMNDRCWWIGIDLPGNGYWAGNFQCDSRGQMSFSEQEQHGFDWDRDDTHERPVPVVSSVNTETQP